MGRKVEGMNYKPGDLPKVKKRIFRREGIWAV